MKALSAPSLVQLAADALRTMILGGDVSPGDRLVEARLTARLGISRPPLREALRLLQREGLVTALPRRGIIVTPITAHDAWEISTLRSALERAAIELTVPLRDPRGLEQCRESLSNMADAATKGDHALLITRSFEFHLSIVSLAGHSRLTEMYRSLSNQMRLCMSLNVSARARRFAESLEENVERHRKLLALIEQGDVETVVAGLSEHGQLTFLADITEAKGPNDSKLGDFAAEIRERRRRGTRGTIRSGTRVK